MVNIDNCFTGFKHSSPSDGSFEVNVPGFVNSNILHPLVVHVPVLSMSQNASVFKLNFV
jgi:hypothetical protein